MKNLLLFVAAICLFSCSDDDSPSEGINLKSMVTSIYADNGALMDRTVMEFQDNKPSAYKIYHPSGAMYRNYEYTYRQDGQLGTMKIYNDGQLAVTEVLEYDSQRRLIKRTSTDHLDFDDISGADYEYEYVHNNDGTITQNIGNGNTNTYYLNNNGQVYKITEWPGFVSEVTYSGNDVLTWSHSGDWVINYTYDDVHPVKGEWRNMFKNQFRGYEANHILYGGHANAITATDRYMVKQEQDNGSTANYGCEFNSAGYPVRVAVSSNGEAPNAFVDITYQ